MGPHGSAWRSWVTPSRGCRTRHNRAPCAEETVYTPRSHEVTRLDVIEAVRAGAVNDEATHATIIHLISSGQARLCYAANTAIMAVLAEVEAAA
jgi:hypothetical protein